MASGGSSARSPKGPMSFDFGPDDVLCSYDDYTTLLDQKANGKRSDPSAMDLHDKGVGRTLSNVYGQQEEFSREDVIYAVEKCMKKYADNVMGGLEGIAGRLTKLELYYCKLERSVGEFRTDMIRDQSETVLKLKSLEKHVHEVHRSVQIIRDKKELSETHKELAKLQLSQKESINSSCMQKNNEDLNLKAAATESKAHNDEDDASNQQLALALPNQIATPPSSLTIRAPDQNQPYKELSMQQCVLVSHSVSPQDHYVLNHANAYNTHRQPLPQEQQSRNLQPVLHYAQKRVQMHDVSIPKQQQNVVANQPTQQQPFPQYQQHWSQPMQLQQPSSQAQAPKLETPPSYAPFAPNQCAGTIPETYQGSSMSLPSPYLSVPQSGGYGVSGSAISHLPAPQNIQGAQLLSQASQGSFGLLPLAKSGYVGTSTYPSQSNLQGYNSVYVIDGSRVAPHQSFHPGSYPPNGNVAAPQMSNNHPYVGMIEKEHGPIPGIKW